MLQGKQLSDLKQRQEHYYNRSAHDLKPLKLNDTVRITPAKDIGHSEMMEMTSQKSPSFHVEMFYLCY